MTYLQPAFLIFLGLIAVGLAWRHLRRWRRLAWGGLALAFLWSWPVFAYLSSGSLEWFYPAEFPKGEADAIVVLSGAVFPTAATIPEPYPGWDTYQRCKYAAWLYRHWRTIPVIATGGPGADELIASRIMRTALEAEGVPSTAITTEEQARSTYENGRNTAGLLRARGITRIALVTEAYHMLRSEKVFRKLGIEVLPAPCDFYTEVFRLNVHNLLPSGEPLEINNRILHEWIGVAWYKLRGQI